jgi:hypothetical protein
MLVDFKVPWFAPTDIVIKDKIQSISGMRFKRGIQEVPDKLKPFLPDTAKIVKKVGDKFEDVTEEVTLKDLDIDRANADASVEAADLAEKNATQIRRDRMAKVRAAKKAKADARKSKE